MLRRLIFERCPTIVAYSLAESESHFLAAVVTADHSLECLLIAEESLTGEWVILLIANWLCHCVSLLKLWLSNLSFKLV